MNNKVFSGLIKPLVETSRIVDLLTGVSFFNSLKNKDFEKEDQETVREIVNNELTDVVSNIKYVYKIYSRNCIYSYKKSMYKMIKSKSLGLDFGKSSFNKELNGRVFKKVFSSKNLKKKTIDKLIYLFLYKILIENNNKNFNIILNNIVRLDEDSSPIGNLLYELFKLQQME